MRLVKIDFIIGDEVGNIIRWDIRANISELIVIDILNL